MHIILAGLNHRTAPVDLREQLTLADCSLGMALDDLVALSEKGSGNRDSEPENARLSETVILSTCNRMEIYAVVVGEPAAGRRLLEQFLADLQGIPLAQLLPHLYFLEDHEAVNHLLRVASGLDSMILGEPQILGQVSAAQAEARAAGAIGPVLTHLFERAVHTGKRARNETSIGRHTTSISHAAAQLVSDELGDLGQAQALIVGAGEMAKISARALLDRGVQQLSFINRTHARAEGLARQFNCRALNWYHLQAALATADVVITTTGAPHIVIHEGDVLPVLPERSGRPLLFVDIAVPRDVENEVGALPGVKRFDIDQLQDVVDANLAQRQTAVPDVEQIIVQETEYIHEWLQSRQVLPVLVELRRKVRNIADEELERNLYQFNELTPVCQQKVEYLVHRIVNKMLHDPTVRLKASAAEGNGVEYAHAIRELFALDTVPLTPAPELSVDSNGNGFSQEPESNLQEFAPEP
jgi:glutamyl-tRNA reductase